MERKIEGSPSYTESQMRSAYCLKVNTLKKQLNEGQYDKDSTLKVGFELECFIVDKKANPVEETKRDKIITALGNNGIEVDYELGASQIEIHTEPVDLSRNNTNLVDDYLIINEKVNRIVIEKDLSVLRIGALPNVSSSNIHKTSQERYKTVPGFFNQNRKQGSLTKIGKTEEVEVGNADIVALFSSIQLNIEAQSTEDAIEKLNYSFMLSPIVTAISSNARFLDYKDTGYSDVRMPAWQISHETRTSEEILRDEETRIGMPNSYYKDISEYFERIGSFPFILKDNLNVALQYTIGLDWQDSRIKVLENQKALVVEFRPVSTQPTPEEDLAVGLFYLGRLIWSQKNSEPLIDPIINKRNKNEVMLNGINATIYTGGIDGNIKLVKAYEALPLELERAKEGLLSIDYDSRNFEHFFALLEKRIVSRKTPSDDFAEKIRTSKSEPHEAITEAIYSIGLSS